MVDTVSDYYPDMRLKYSRLSRQNPLLLDGAGVTDEEFYAFCMENPELRIERNANGKIMVMPPINSETGHYNSEIHLEIGIWNRKHKLGVTFDSSTGDIQTVSFDHTLSGGDVMPGLELRMAEVLGI